MNINDLSEKEVFDLIQQNKLDYMDFIRWVNKVSHESYKDGVESVDINWFE